MTTAAIFYVYIHKDPEGNVFYVGKGKDNRAFRPTGRPQAWRDITATTKYSVEFIETGLTEEAAFALEVATIEHYGLENLTNVSAGGRGCSGYRHTEKAKHKIGLASAGEGNPMFGKPGTNLGKKFDENHRANISKALVGRKGPPCPEHVKASLSVRYSGKNNPQYDPTIYNFIHKTGKKRTCSPYELYTEFGLARPNLAKVITGKLNHTGGWSIDR